MSLLPNNTFASPGNPLFTSSGGGTGNPAPQFTATGIADAGGFISTGAGGNVTLKQGVFETTAVIDPLTGDVDVMRIKSSAGLNRWEMGIQGTESGANAGANLFIRASSDAGSAIATPLVIERDSGIVNVTQGLVANDATVGGAAVVGGGILSIDGTLGASRVFDAVYHPIPPAGGFLVSLSSATQNGTPAAGVTVLPMGASFTVPTTGLYLFTAKTLVDVGAGAGEDIVVNSSDYCAVSINTSPPTPGFISSTFTMVTPIPMTYTTNTPAGTDYVITTTNIVSLTAGIPYAMSAFVYSGIAGTMRFPASAPGGVTFSGTLAPLLGNS